jgi:hypothetical protein
LGAGFIFTLNTGRTISLMGVRAKDRKTLSNRRVADSATEHVVGLKFARGGLDDIEVASRVSGGSAKVPEKLPNTRVRGTPRGTDVLVDEAMIREITMRTEMSKARWEQVRPKSCSELTMKCLKECCETSSSEGPGSVGYSGYNPTDTSTTTNWNE